MEENGLSSVEEKHRFMNVYIDKGGMLNINSLTENSREKKGYHLTGVEKLSVRSKPANNWLC